MQITQIAKFSISSRWIEQNPSEAAEVFSLLKIVPLKVDHWFHKNEFEYVAASENFRPVDIGIEVPTVDIAVTRDESGKIVSAKAVYPGEGK